MDVISCSVPIGIFFGRITNFINSELWGKPTSLPWEWYFLMVVMLLDTLVKYMKLCLEGIVLFLILNYFYKKSFL